MKILKNSPKWGQVEILIDDEDFHYLENGCYYIYSKDGKVLYVHLEIKGKHSRLHRLIMKPKEHESIDHINGNGLDNRKSNLRICTNAENSRNKKKRDGKFTSKYKGVCHHTNSRSLKKWYCQIAKDGKKIFIGRYSTEEEAALAYNKKATELFGEFASINEDLK
jgi:hypothetical protein